MFHLKEKPLPKHLPYWKKQNPDIKSTTYSEYSRPVVRNPTRLPIGSMNGFVFGKKKTLPENNVYSHRNFLSPKENSTHDRRGKKDKLSKRGSQETILEYQKLSVSKNDFGLKNSLVGSIA